MEKGRKKTGWQQGMKEIQREVEDSERDGGRIGLKFSDNEMSPVIVPVVINGVPLYSGSPCPWDSKR